ncbi:MAG: glycosyl hydrolase, partial [Bacteroidia bacterium]|nr:glycosyl hydrolase [Bacteroidia bacterium]
SQTLIFKEFENPPHEYSILPFWGWNGTLKENEIKRQIDMMLDKGIYGAFMHARKGIEEEYNTKTPYFSEGWWNAVDVTLQYSKEKKFYACLYDEDKWPSGSAGGRTVASNPKEFAKKGLKFTRDDYAVSDVNMRIKLPKSNVLKLFAVQLTGENSFIRSSQIDLSNSPNSYWDIPNGKWAILSFSLIEDPKQVDYLDSSAVASFINITHEAYYSRFAKYFGNTISGVFFDEIYFDIKQKDVISWTDDFDNTFKQRFGYDILNELPSLILESEKSMTFSYDYFSELSNRYDKAWFVQYADWCKNHKIWLTGHTLEELDAYKREGDYFKTIGRLQIPATDNEDFRRTFPRKTGWYKPKQLASVAHIYGRQRAGAEAMGGGGYMITPEEYKYGFASLGVLGINFFIPHMLKYSVENVGANEDWPPSWFFTNPYWKYFKPLADYGRRISYMVSQGNHICHAAILYPIEQQWAAGYYGKVSGMEYTEIQEVLLHNQIDYDIITPDVLLISNIKDSKLSVQAEEYSVLIIPPMSVMSANVAKKLEDFCQSGGKVIAIGEISHSDPKGKDKELQQTLNKLFNSNNAQGAYMTKDINSLPEIINKHITNEVEVISGSKADLRFHQRQTDDKTMQFLFMNESTNQNYFVLSTLNYGKPYKMNIETGESHEVTNYSSDGDRVYFSFDFIPREAFFLTFEKGKAGDQKMMIGETSLKDASIIYKQEKPFISGWGNANEPQFAEVLDLKRQNEYIKLPAKSAISNLALSNVWTFMPFNNEEEDRWTDNVVQDTIDIPVMKFYTDINASGTNYANPDIDDSYCTTVKIADKFNSEKGGERYLSSWNSYRIMYFNKDIRLKTLGGSDAVFRKTFNLCAKPLQARMKITADPSYELEINGYSVGRDSIFQTIENYDINKFLKLGENQILIKVPNHNGVIAEGDIFTSKEVVHLNTNDTWCAKEAGTSTWGNVFIHSKPPLGGWSSIRFDSKEPEFPINAWYRQVVPVGADALLLSTNTGTFEYYLNGEVIAPVNGKIVIPEKYKGQKIIFAVKSKFQKLSDGISSPIRAVVHPVSVTLNNWESYGLGWFSGRGIYTQEFSLPKDYINANLKLILNPGKINWFAEIWINHKLVRFCPWGEFPTDITKYVNEGTNVVSIIVSNLSANKEYWDVPDAVLNDSFSRWWHNGATDRESNCLESGLLGPVQIIPQTVFEKPY